MAFSKQNRSTADDVAAIRIVIRRGATCLAGQVSAPDDGQSINTNLHTDRPEPLTTHSGTSIGTQEYSASPH